MTPTFTINPACNSPLGGLDITVDQPIGQAVFAWTEQKDKASGNVTIVPCGQCQIRQGDDNEPLAIAITKRDRLWMPVQFVELMTDHELKDGHGQIWTCAQKIPPEKKLPVIEVICASWTNGNKPLAIRGISDADSNVWTLDPTKNQGSYVIVL